MSLALASGFFTTSATCEASPLPNKTSKQTKIKMKWIFFSDDFFFQLHIKCDLTTFSPCLPLVFSFSEWCFAEQKFLLLIEFNLIRVFFFFLLWIMLQVSLRKISCLTLDHADFFLIISSRSCVMLCFTFRSMIYLELQKNKVLRYRFWGFTYFVLLILTLCLERLSILSSSATLFLTSVVYSIS